MTVIARICLDMLRARRARSEESLETLVPHALADSEHVVDPGQEMEMATSVGLALLVVLDTLAPAERLAFVLHDIFDVPFDEIAPIVEREVAATRQLASRARRRVRAKASLPDADLAINRAVAEAFLTAAREGNLDALLTVLAPEVILRRDPLSVPAEAAGELRGAATVAKQFVGRAQATQPALVNGSVGVVVAPFGWLRGIIELSISGGKITTITTISDSARLHQVHLAVLVD